MDSNDIKLRLNYWLIFQIFVPLMPFIFEVFIRISIAEDTYYSIFRTQKLTLIAFILFLNMAVNLVLDKQFIKSRKKSISELSTINFNLFIALSILILIIYSALLVFAYTSIKESDISLQSGLIILSISVYLSFILLAYIMLTSFLKSILNLSNA